MTKLAIILVACVSSITYIIVVMQAKNCSDLWQLLGIAENDFLQLLNDRLDLAEVEKIRSGEISDGRDKRNDAKLRKSDEERIVGSHEWQELCHGVGDAGGDDTSEEHLAHGVPERFVEQLATRATMQNKQQNNNL